MQDYRKLRVWHDAHAHTLSVRAATNRFPRSGYANLKGQLLEAAESIVFNIVEGSGAATQKEFGRFLDISIKSSCETEYQLQLARDYEILSESDWERLSERTITIRKMLCKLRARVIASAKPENGADPDS